MASSMMDRNLMSVDSLERLLVGLAGADPDRLCELVDENLAVTDLAGTGRVDDGLDDALQRVVGHRQLEFHLGQEIHHVFGASIEFSVTLLAPETLDLGHSNALHADLRKRLADVVQLERLDDRRNHFHFASPDSGHALGMAAAAGGRDGYCRARPARSLALRRHPRGGCQENGRGRFPVPGRVSTLARRVSVAASVAGLAEDRIGLEAAFVHVDALVFLLLGYADSHHRLQ